ncbi:hypothetical protein [Streptomyces sp. NPDC005828]|uniref:hypothetical protein n=1 Tax=Streptomyces sp. NPDC005828 TaxID=3157071 RepID=UPI0033E9A222
MALVIATALAVGVAPAVLGGAAAVAAPTPAAATVTGGTVVQEGGPLVVPSGEGAVTTRVTVTLPAGVTGPVKARLLLPITWEFAGDAYPIYWDIRPECAVDGGAFEPCPLQVPAAGANHGPYVATLPVTEAATTLTYDIRIDSSIGARQYGDVAGTLEVADAEGAVSASGTVAFQFARNTPSAGLRTTVLARDKGGVLWQYESTGFDDKPLKPRKRIGGGWNVYTSITSLTPRTAAGDGDLVARDKSGVLWYYQGSKNPDAPFKPRVRVGGGWNAYTAITARGGGGGGGGLVARDRDGRLWYYAPTGSGNPSAPFQAPRGIGGGWNAYSLIVGQRPSSGLVARDKAGVLWSYWPNVQTWPGFLPRTRVGGGWNAYDRIVLADNLGGSRDGDYLAREADGHLWLYEGVNRTGNLIPHESRRKIGWGWNIYDVIL